MKAKKIVLLIALGVLLAGFLLWAVGAALGAKTLYLHNGELTVGDQPMGGFSIGSYVSVAASSKEGAAGLPLRYNKDKRKNPVFSRVSAFVVAYSIPFPTLIVNEKSVE